MKYMKGVNLNDDEAYLKQHFDEEDNTQQLNALMK